MKIRSATVDVDYTELTRALTAHMTGALLGQVTRHDGFEAPPTGIMVQIDGGIRSFGVQHVVTDYTEVTGLVLCTNALSEPGDSAVNLEYVLIRFYGVEYEALSFIYSMTEEEADDNRGRTLLNLLEKLYTQ
jgi:hypothetical protein